MTEERDQLKLKIESIQRDHLNQTFGKLSNSWKTSVEMNLNMKEEIENVREETLIKNE